MRGQGSFCRTNWRNWIHTREKIVRGGSIFKVRTQDRNNNTTLLVKWPSIPHIDKQVDNSSSFLSSRITKNSSKLTT